MCGVVCVGVCEAFVCVWCVWFRVCGGACVGCECGVYVVCGVLVLSW